MIPADPAPRPAPRTPALSQPEREPLPPPPLVGLAAEGAIVAPCPQCGAPMFAMRGSKLAVCRNCGFKDSCCY
jgi:hypothetical protein